MAMTVVIFGRFASCGEGDVLSGGEGRHAFRAGDGSGSCFQIVSGSYGDVSIGANLRAEFRAALGAQIVLCILRHVFLALELLCVKRDVFSRREEDAAILAKRGERCTDKLDVLSCAGNEDAFIPLDGDACRRVQYVLVRQMLARALCRYISLGIQHDRLLAENRALDADVFFRL